VTGIFQILRAIREEKPNVIWFNLILSSFGDQPAPAFLGLMLPFVSQLLGFKCCVTLHHLTAFLDYTSTRYYGRERAYRFFGGLAELCIAKSGVVVLLLDKYVDYFRGKYRASNVVRLHHGFPLTDRVASVTPRRHILVFGKFGSYKKLDFAIQVFENLRRVDASWEMTIAGGSHPSYLGYYEEVAEHSKGIPGLRFTGYIPDAALGGLFSSAGVVFLPYTSATGVSGVAHHAAASGVPVVCPDIEDFQAMEREEGIAVRFFKPSDVASAAEALSLTCEDMDLWGRMSAKSLAVARERSFDRIWDSYIDLFQNILKRV
jgi:glycosyltransferase involved in cell wall biosynthesis